MPWSSEVTGIEKFRIQNPHSLNSRQPLYIPPFIKNLDPLLLFPVNPFYHPHAQILSKSRIIKRGFYSELNNHSFFFSYSE